MNFIQSLKQQTSLSLDMEINSSSQTKRLGLKVLQVKQEN